MARYKRDLSGIRMQVSTGLATDLALSLKPGAVLPRAVAAHADGHRACPAGGGWIRLEMGRTRPATLCRALALALAFGQCAAVMAPSRTSLGGNAELAARI